MPSRFARRGRFSLRVLTSAALWLFVPAILQGQQQAVQVRVVQPGRVEVGRRVDLPPRIVVTMPVSATAIPAVSLRLADPEQPFAIRGGSVAPGSSATVTFDSLVVLPVGYVSGVPSQLSLLIDVGGDEVTGVRLEVAVRPPARERLLLRATFPDTIAVGVPFEAAITASATLEGVTLAIRNSPVTVLLPDGSVSPERRTGPDGRAVFTGLEVRGAPGPSRLVFSLSQFGRSTERAIVLTPGPAASVTITRNLPARFAVGTTLDLEFLVRDAGKNALAGQAVSFALDRPGGRRLGSERGQTGGDGLARIQLPYLGPAGEVRLIATAGSGADTLTMTAERGEPRILEVVQDVAPRLVADSILEQPLVVRVMDAGRNVLADVPVRLELCWTSTSQGNAGVRCAGDAAPPNPEDQRDRFFRGLHTRSSDATGRVRFDSLRVIGPSGSYRIRALVDGNTEVRTESGWMRYDADDVYDRSFVIISAIKSVAGTKPANEFFDIRFQFRLSSRWHLTLHSDLALSRASTTDSVNVQSPQERVNDATVGINYSPAALRVEDPVTDAPERRSFVGTQLRIFNTVPFIMWHVGSVELARSMFHGSSMVLGPAYAPDTTPVLANGAAFRPARWNLVADAFARSSGIDFFKFLNIRATVLIPVGVRGRRPLSRIVIAVPIGGLTTF